MLDAGLVVICSFISPFRADRRRVRDLLQNDEFMEIFVNTPLEECIRRDPKGHYKRAHAGEIAHFTGVDQPYESPENPDVILTTINVGPDMLAETVITALRHRTRSM